MDIILAIILTSIVTTLGCAFLFAGKLAIEKMVAYDRGWNEGFEEGHDKGYDLGWGEGLSEPPGDDPKADYRGEGIAHLKG